MGANSIKEKYNQENDVSLNISINKSCYDPGETISGYLDIQPKYNINQTIFNDTQAIFKITQLQQYDYSVGSGEDESTIYVNEDSDIFTLDKHFDYFCGANILVGIKIPFSIQIPLEIQPTLYYSGYYIKHFFSVELPGIKAKKSLIILIKEHKMYTIENKLLKMPAFGFGDFYKKKKGEYKGGKVSCLLEIPKNSFTFNEFIPFKIDLNCTELNLEIKLIRVRIMEFIYCNYKDDHKKRLQTSLDRELNYKEFPISGNQNKYEINNDIKIPNVNIGQEIYNIFETIQLIEVDYDFNKFGEFLMPFCVGGLISSEFALNVEIKYEKHRTISSFNLPIEILNNENSDIKSLIALNNIKNDLKQKIENDKKFNINSIDDYNIKKSNENIDNFEVIDHDDFQKAFFGEK